MPSMKKRFENVDVSASDDNDAFSEYKRLFTVEANNVEGMRILISAGTKLCGQHFSPSTLIETAYRKGYSEII